ncbi:MAG: hypothetical protein Q8R18_03650 [bacterium]|nr:hypothetical protein [bacterium]
MANILFTTRQRGELYKRNDSHGRNIAIDVSGYGEEPFCFLSPYTFGKNIELPVPGMENQSGHSVEGIWQGLKLVSGRINPSYFTRHPKKRNGIIEGHKFGEEVLDLLEARRKIYIPTYTRFLDDYAPQEALDFIREQERVGRQVFLYDTDENGDVRDPRPLAHASILAAYLNMVNISKPLEARTVAEKRLSRILNSRYDLSDKIARVEKLLASPELVQAFQYRCIDHPQDVEEYTLGQYFLATKLGSNSLHVA